MSTRAAGCTLKDHVLLSFRHFVIAVFRLITVSRVGIVARMENKQGGYGIGDRWMIWKYFLKKPSQPSKIYGEQFKLVEYSIRKFYTKNYFKRKTQFFSFFALVFSALINKVAMTSKLFDFFICCRVRISDENSDSQHSPKYNTLATTGCYMWGIYHPMFF